MSQPPKYSSDVPFVPMSFNDRDILVGQLMEVLEAVLPEGKQLEATKNLVKKTLSQHFIRSFNDQYEILNNRSASIGSPIEKYMQAIWDVAQQSPEFQSRTNSGKITTSSTN